MNDVLRDERERGWFHLDNAIIDEYLPRIGVTAFAVYACIVRHSDKYGEAFPSYSKLQQELGCGRSQVAAAIKKIVDAGLVTIKPGKRASNVYQIVTVSTSPKSELVPIRNQSRRETGTSSAPGPELVPLRDSNNTQLTRPKEQDPIGRESARANGTNGHSGLPPPRRFGNAMRFPETFVVTDELHDWVIEHKMPRQWAANRIESFVSHYGTSDTMTTLEGWYDKCRKWLLDDWAKQRDSGLTARR